MPNTRKPVRRNSYTTPNQNDTLIAGCLLILVIFPILFALSALIYGAITLLVWNGFDLHSAFNLSPLTFWQAMGVGIALSIISSLLGGGARATINR